VAVYAAMAGAVAQIVSDRPKFAVTPAMLYYELEAPVPMGYGNHESIVAHNTGIVAKVERKGDLVAVTFKTDKYTEDELDCKSGPRIVMFSPDGTPIYEWLCKRTGRKITRSETSPPFETYPELARGIEPGMFVRYGDWINSESKLLGIPFEVWKTSEMKSLVAIFGIRAR
jgi:hypothetical protein